MIRVKLLEDAMDKKNITKKDLATKLGIGLTSLYQRFNGNVLFKIDELKTIKEYLELPDERFKEIFFD